LRSEPVRKFEVIRRIKDHKDEIAAFKAEALYLYGSTVRDEATPASDIDLSTRRRASPSSS
jgi:predicted nucleotidyltransferase